MSSISSFERHLPEQLYTVLEEKKILDGEKHVYDKADHGSITVYCKDSGTKKEHVVIKLKVTDQRSMCIGMKKTITLFRAYKEKDLLYFANKDKSNYIECKPDFKESMSSLHLEHILEILDIYIPLPMSSALTGTEA
ncbi:MAG: hypothetical protein K940chlam8_01269 [Chlamydiae bacterium]|nr:hypothetical protein [Chlamydiota bacterium]